MQRHTFSVAVILSLVALRVGIGMHFFREGLNKYRDPQPFSAGFLGNAKGPWADRFHQRVWDRDGFARLDQEKTLQEWDQFRARAERHFGFTDPQRKQAARVQKRTEDQLKDHFAVNSTEIDEYLYNVARRDRYLADRQRMETPSLKDQVEKLDSELRKTRTKLIGPIDLMWQGYVRDMNAIATPEQRQAHGVLHLDKPGRRFLDSEGIDRIIPWFDMVIGVLLITGLATRFAAGGAALFLLSVIISQWPASPGAVPTWPQFIEMLGLLVVAATGAGQFAGVDGILSTFRRRERPRSSASAPQRVAVPS